MQHLAEHDHVVGNVTGTVASAAEQWEPSDLAEIVRYTMDSFGPDRVMFASNWPVCTLRALYRG